MQEEGYVAQILYPEGSKDIPLGKVIAILVEDEADVAAFKDFKQEGGAKPAKKAAAKKETSQAAETPASSSS